MRIGVSWHRHTQIEQFKLKFGDTFFARWLKLAIKERCLYMMQVFFASVVVFQQFQNNGKFVIDTVLKWNVTKFHWKNMLFQRVKLKLVLLKCENGFTGAVAKVLRFRFK